MLDAYTVRKAIPKLVLAVIAINLSIYLCVAALDITTIIGKGLNQILVSPFIDDQSFNGIKLENNTQNNVGGILAGGGILVGIIGFIFVSGGFALSAIAILGLLLPLVITIALIALAVLFTLIIRQGLLVFLTVVSPVAIACYILPGTEKYFKQWLDLFTKTLMVYPIIAAIFAMSNVMAAILLSNASGANPGAMFQSGYQFAQASASNTVGVVQLLVVIIVLYAPLFLIPFSFKLAGGILGQIAGVASGRAGNMAGRLNKGFEGYKKNPDSLFGRKKLESQSSRADRGLTGKGLSANLAFGKDNRRQRRAAARTFDTARVMKANSESLDYAAIKDDSDATTDLALHSTSQSSRDAIEQKYKDNLAKGMDATNATRIYDNDRRASAVADKFRGNNAYRRMALMEAGTIKYGLDEGEAGWKQATDAMQDIAGGDAGQLTNMMNQFQYVAPGAGRADLSGNTNGDLEFKGTRGWEKQSLYEAANAHPTSIKGYAEEAQKLLQSNDIDDRTKGAVMVEEFKTMRSNAKGGVAIELNKALGSQGSGGLLDSQANHYRTSFVGPDQIEMVPEQYQQTIQSTAPGAQAGDTETVTKTRMKQQQVTLADIERRKVAGLSRIYERPNPDIIESQNQPNPPNPNVPSDKRLKKEIDHVHTLSSGIRLYSFKYFWSEQIYVGVMAQEILRTHPQAVSKDKNGFYAVDYGLLGVRMVTIEEWHSQQSYVVAR